jgi:hypothetical protein
MAIAGQRAARAAEAGDCERPRRIGAAPRSSPTSRGCRRWGHSEPSANEARGPLAQLDDCDRGRVGALAALRAHERAHAARPSDDQLRREPLGRRAIERREHRQRRGGPGCGVAGARHPRVQEGAQQRDAERGGDELRGSERRAARSARAHGGERDDRAERQRQQHPRARQPDSRERALGQRRRLCVGAAGQQQPDIGVRPRCPPRPHGLRRTPRAEQRRDRHQCQPARGDPEPGHGVIDADDAARHAEHARDRQRPLVRGPDPDGLRARSPAELAQPPRDQPRGAPLGICARPAPLDGAQLVGDLLRIHPGAGQ